VKSDYNPDDAGGLIRLNGLRLRARHTAQGGADVASKSRMQKG
jgi:hypothetical protein